MKIYKACLICSLIIGLALFVRAANPWEGDRPERVRAENWIRISDLAGIVVSHMSSDKIAGVLYVKRDDKWIQVSIENPQGVVE
jgi:glyoxylase-like metal-dependent hydrolase (beta-lactamase superfamily II)